jgi:hypothetical protein
MLSLMPSLPLQQRTAFGKSEELRIIESLPVTQHEGMSSPPQSAHPQNEGPIFGGLLIALAAVIALPALLNSKKPK